MVMLFNYLFVDNRGYEYYVYEVVRDEKEYKEMIRKFKFWFKLVKWSLVKGHIWLSDKKYEWDRDKGWSIVY